MYNKSIEINKQTKSLQIKQRHKEVVEGKGKKERKQWKKVGSSGRKQEVVEGISGSSGKQRKKRNTERRESKKNVREKERIRKIELA